MSLKVSWKLLGEILPLSINLTTISLVVLSICSSMVAMSLLPWPGYAGPPHWFISRHCPSGKEAGRNLLSRKIYNEFGLLLKIRSGVKAFGPYRQVNVEVNSKFQATIGHNYSWVLVLGIFIIFIKQAIFLKSINFTFEWRNSACWVDLHQKYWRTNWHPDLNFLLD